MGTPIGNYVHHKAENYKQYLTNRRQDGVGPAFNAQDQKNKIKERINANKSKMTEGEKQTLKENLAYILSTQNYESDEYVQRIWDKTIEVLQEQFHNRLGSINMDTGNITVAEVQSSRNKAITLLGSKSKIYIPTIQNHMAQIYDRINNLKDNTKKQSLLNEVDAINAAFNNIIKESSEVLLDVSGFTCTYKVEGEHNARTSNLISDLNNIICGLNAALPINLQKGELFEYLLTYSAGVGKQLGEKTALDWISTSAKKTGNIREDVIIDKNNFCDEFDPAAVGLNIRTENGSLITVGSSQTKVDVEILLEKGTPIKISAKNVNLFNKRGVFILSSGNFLALIQDLDAEFVNHYLNLTADHPDSGLSEENMAAAREIMKIALAWKALSGDNYGRQAADIFIVNNNVITGPESIQIYDIASLGELFLEDIDAYASISPNIDQMTWKNEFIEGEPNLYKTRINNLLADLHKAKISVALNTQLFKNKSA